MNVSVLRLCMLYITENYQGKDLRTEAHHQLVQNYYDEPLLVQEINYSEYEIIKVKIFIDKENRQKLENYNENYSFYHNFYKAVSLLISEILSNRDKLANKYRSDEIYETKRYEHDYFTYGWLAEATTLYSNKKEEVNDKTKFETEQWFELKVTYIINVGFDITEEFHLIKSDFIKGIMIINY